MWCSWCDSASCKCWKIIVFGWVWFQIVQKFIISLKNADTWQKYYWFWDDSVQKSPKISLYRSGALVSCCSGVRVVDHWFQNGWFWILTSLVIYYEQINNCAVTDGPLAGHSVTIVIAELGPRLEYQSFENSSREKFDSALAMRERRARGTRRHPVAFARAYDTFRRFRPWRPAL